MFEKSKLPAPDSNGLFCHPDVPGHDEDDDVAVLLDAMGWDAALASGADIVDDDTLEYDATKWEPERPLGDSWILVSKFDTEEGPYALFVRPKADDEAARAYRDGVCTEHATPADRFLCVESHRAGQRMQVVRGLGW